MTSQTAVRSSESPAGEAEASSAELENPNLSVNSRAELSCEAAKVLEFKGEYEKARRLLSNHWTRIGERPNVTDLEPIIAAEVLLRAGVLTGWIGSSNQIAWSQEQAKNLISESLTIFQSSRKVAEAQTELALCYWRTGEYNEARDLLHEALERLTTDSEVKAKAIVRLGIVQCEVASYSKALRVLTENAALFERINNETLKGSYHVTLHRTPVHEDGKGRSSVGPFGFLPTEKSSRYVRGHVCNRLFFQATGRTRRTTQRISVPE